MVSNKVKEMQRKQKELQEKLSKEKITDPTGRVTYPKSRGGGGSGGGVSRSPVPEPSPTLKTPDVFVSRQGANAELQRRNIEATRFRERVTRGRTVTRVDGSLRYELGTPQKKPVKILLREKDYIGKSTIVNKLKGTSPKVDKPSQKNVDYIQRQQKELSVALKPKDTTTIGSVTVSTGTIVGGTITIPNVVTIGGGGERVEVPKPSKEPTTSIVVTKSPPKSFTRKVKDSLTFERPSDSRSNVLTNPFKFKRMLFNEGEFKSPPRPKTKKRNIATKIEIASGKISDKIYDGTKLGKVSNVLQSTQKFPVSVVTVPVIEKVFSKDTRISTTEAGKYLLFGGFMGTTVETTKGLIRRGTIEPEIKINTFPKIVRKGKLTEIKTIIGTESGGLTSAMKINQTLVKNTTGKYSGGAGKVVVTSQPTKTKGLVTDSVIISRGEELGKATAIKKTKDLKLSREVGTGVLGESYIGEVKRTTTRRGVRFFTRSSKTIRKTPKFNLNAEKTIRIDLEATGKTTSIISPAGEPNYFKVSGTTNKPQKVLTEKGFVYRIPKEDINIQGLGKIIKTKKDKVKFIKPKKIKKSDSIISEGDSLYSFTKGKVVGDKIIITEPPKFSLDRFKGLTTQNEKRILQESLLKQNKGNSLQQVLKEKVIKEKVIKKTKSLSPTKEEKIIINSHSAIAKDITKNLIVESIETPSLKNKFSAFSVSTGRFSDSLTTSKFGNLGVFDTRLSPKIKTKQDSRQGLKLNTQSIFTTGSITKSDVAEKQQNKIKTITVFQDKSNQRTKQQSGLRLKQNLKQRQSSIHGGININTKVPKIITFPITFKPYKSFKQPKGTFGVSVRQQGKFKPIGKGLSLQKAITVGSGRVRRTISATFRITPESKGIVIGGFRTPKGFKRKKGLIFIEEPKYRLNQSIEVKQIQSGKRNSIIMKGGIK